AEWPAVKPVAPTELMALIKREFDQSHALVDRVYELESAIPPMDNLTLTDPAVRDFTSDRMHASARFTATVFLTAWRGSAEVRLPDWLDRSVFDHDFDPAVIPPQPGR